MKSINTIIGALLLTLGAIGIASCSQEEDNAVMQEKGNLLKIETSIAETKAIVTGTEFKTGDQISVITPWDVDYFNNLATYDGNWQMKEVMLPENPSIVGAVYPYEAGLRREEVRAAGIAWWVYRQDVDLTYKEDGQTDYMYGLSTNEVSLSDGTARIQFQHALARITLALTKSGNDVGEGLVSRVILRNRSTEDFYAVISNKGIFTVDTRLQKGYIYGDKDATATIEVPAKCALSSTVVQNIDMLVIPTTINEDAEFVLTIDGNDYNFIIPQSEWEAGQQYTYPVTISRNTVPTPEPTVGEAIYMGFDGDDGQPLYWSSWNLGATSPEDYGGFYGWGDPTGEHTEQSSYENYGNYIQDLNTCLTFYGGVNPPENICGTELDVVKAMWGGSWRLPSKDEFDRLIDNCSIEIGAVNEVDGPNEIQGYWFTSNINGNTLFFPRTPVRYGEEIVYDENNFGVYWTGNLYRDKYARVVKLSDYTVNYAMERYMGHSIRPVTSNPK